jgi:hypothetical protein
MQQQTTATLSENSRDKSKYEADLMAIVTNQSQLGKNKNRCRE